MQAPGSSFRFGETRRRDMRRHARWAASAWDPQASPRVPDPEPALDVGLLALCQWMAEYYAAPLGVALRSALPAALIRRGAAGSGTQDAADRRPRGTSAIPTRARAPFACAPRQREVFEFLESVGGRSPVDLLLSHVSCSPAVVRSLAAMGSSTSSTKSSTATPSPLVRSTGGAACTDRRPDGPRSMRWWRRRRGEVALLHGVTGSGKTLVYIELLREIVDRRGQSAIVLVPRSRLTPQTVDRFRAVFGDRVAVLHSALSEGERYDAWLALRVGAKRIAVGAQVRNLRAPPRPRRHHRR